MQNNNFHYEIKSPFEEGVVDMTKSTDDFVPWANQAKEEDFRGPLHENLREVLAGATRTVDNPRARKRTSRRTARRSSGKSAHVAS